MKRLTLFSYIYIYIYIPSSCAHSHCHPSHPTLSLPPQTLQLLPLSTLSLSFSLSHFHSQSHSLMWSLTTPLFTVHSHSLSVPRYSSSHSSLTLVVAAGLYSTLHSGANCETHSRIILASSIEAKATIFLCRFWDWTLSRKGSQILSLHIIVFFFFHYFNALIHLDLSH